MQYIYFKYRRCETAKVHLREAMYTNEKRTKLLSLCSVRLHCRSAQLIGYDFIKCADISVTAAVVCVSWVTHTECGVQSRKAGRLDFAYRVRNEQHSARGVVKRFSNSAIALALRLSANGSVVKSRNVCGQISGRGAAEERLLRQHAPR